MLAKSNRSFIYTSCHLMAIIFIWYFGITTLSGQTSKDTSDLILFEEAEYGTVLTKDQVSIFSGEVSFSHSGVYFFADTVIRAGNSVRAIGNVLIQQGDTLNIFGDSLHYDAGTKQCIIFSNVAFLKEDQKLYTEKLTYNTQTKIATYDLNGVFTNGVTWVKSRTCTYNTQTDDVELAGNVIIQDQDFDIKSQRLRYNLDRRYVTFLSPTIITQQNGTKLYCESGFYDIDRKYGEFIGNPQFQKGTDKAIANKKMLYDGIKQYYELRGDARYLDSLRFVSGEVIKYYEAIDYYEIEGGNQQAFYQDSTQTLSGRNIKFDKKNNNFVTEGRSRLEDKENILEADFNQFDNQTGKGVSKGNVVWYSKENKSTIWANETEIDRNQDFVKAYGDRAMFSVHLDNDTVYLSADTLLSYKRDTVATDSVRIIQAFYNVKILSANFQGTCDSLYFTSLDSIFRMYDEPLLWSDTTNQFSGDTILLSVADNKLSTVTLLNHGLILSTPEEAYFNQIGGRNIVAFMVDSKLDVVEVEGSTQTVFYNLNENDEYTGVNTLDCSNLRATMKDNKLDKAKFYKQNDGKYYPMHKADHGAIQLKGFKWEVAHRPGSLEQMRENGANVAGIGISHGYSPVHPSQPVIEPIIPQEHDQEKIIKPKNSRSTNNK